MKNEIKLYTKHSILECLKAKSPINSITTLKYSKDKRIKHIIDLAEKNQIKINYLENTEQLNEIANTDNHQKIIAHIPKNLKTYEINSIISINKIPLIVICDNITDTSNLGNIIRTAEAFNVSGIIICKKNFNTLINENSFRTSCGAIFNIKICLVSNINYIIDKLKKQNIWIIGSVISENKNFYLNNMDFKLPLAIILGSENNGLNELTKKKCDFLATIPILGKTSSLNVTNAFSILLYEIIRQRNFI